MCCEFVDYVPSVKQYIASIVMNLIQVFLFFVLLKPVQDGYRNKCEFSFGYNVDESG